MFNHKNGSERRASKQKLELDAELAKVRLSQGGVVLEKSTKINEKKAPYTPPVLHRTSKAGSPASVVDMVNQMCSGEETMRNTGKGIDAAPVFNPLATVSVQNMPVKNSASASAQQTQTECTPVANSGVKQVEERRVPGCFDFFTRLLPNHPSSKTPGKASR